MKKTATFSILFMHSHKNEVPYTSYIAHFLSEINEAEFGRTTAYY